MDLPSFNLSAFVSRVKLSFFFFVLWMCVSLYELISFLSTSFQFWPCMKMSSSARHQGAPEEVMSTATVAPTGGTATWDHCTLLVHGLQYPANVFDFLPNQSLRLSHRCCREGLQTSGWEPEMQTSAWSLTEVCCQTKLRGFLLLMWPHAGKHSEQTKKSNSVLQWTEVETPNWGYAKTR